MKACRTRASAVALGCVTVLAAVGGAWAASPPAAERPPRTLWSEFPLVPPAAPAPGAVAGARAEAKRPAPTPAQIELPDRASAVSGSLLLALLVGNALLFGGIAILLIRARGGGLATMGVARPRASQPQRQPRASIPAWAGVAACEIGFRPGHMRSRFYARPLGGDSSSSLPLALSPAFAAGLPAEAEEAKQALNELVRGLQAAGWELFERGEAWFELRFRRSA